MGRLIATTQATLDGVIDPVGAWCRRMETTATTRSSGRPNQADWYLVERSMRGWPGTGRAKPARRP
jgi:hypothetical protein